ncbi:helix-turn-helix transcriptional regulator [Azotobacter salinestris]|uniref:helix-turn-helix transcriptional regulator n=1 Tax=Azotobacter salinestris TaxID=69964 RepID=UPI0012669F30|nr:WYL domain-containing protein [Azotobacter salinestris]
MLSLKHEVLLRLRAIELIAFWEGRLITTQLMDWFGITRQQASSDINRYNSEFNPEALVHDPAVKGYIPAAGFQPVFTSGHINDYLGLLASQGSEPMAQILESHPGVATVQLPDRTVRPEVVREVIKASRNAGSLKILYASMSNPQPHERVISPHTLVYTGFRWHVRAWCHKRQAFRDFLLSRIDRTPRACAESAPSMKNDSLWNEQITLTLIPNLRLSDAQKALVERDFAMPEGRMQINVRKALAHYTLQRYQAAISEEETERVREHLLQLLPADRAKLEPYLFGSEGE